MRRRGRRARRARRRDALLAYILSRGVIQVAEPAAACKSSVSRGALVAVRAGRGAVSGCASLCGRRGCRHEARSSGKKQEEEKKEKKAAARSGGNVCFRSCSGCCRCCCSALLCSPLLLLRAAVLLRAAAPAPRGCAALLRLRLLSTCQGAPARRSLCRDANAVATRGGRQVGRQQAGGCGGRAGIRGRHGGATIARAPRSGGTGRALQGARGARARAPFAHAPFAHAPFAHAPFAHAPFAHASRPADRGCGSRAGT
jgi:hypothetical protein